MSGGRISDSISGSWKDQLNSKDTQLNDLIHKHTIKIKREVPSDIDCIDDIDSKKQKLNEIGDVIQRSDPKLEACKSQSVSKKSCDEQPLSGKLTLDSTEGTVKTELDPAMSISGNSDLRGNKDIQRTDKGDSDDDLDVLRDSKVEDSARYFINISKLKQFLEKIRKHLTAIYSNFYFV